MGARILVIEDDAASLRLLTYILSQVGHSVGAATNGGEGLLAALRNEHDLVLCDLQMPELSGYDVLKRLQSDPAWRPVPVIAVTAYSMPGDRGAALAAGFAGYFTKPIDPAEFVNQIGRFLAAHPRED